MEIKAEAEQKFYSFDFKTFVLVAFMFILFIVCSFTILSMIGFFVTQGDEETVQAVSYSKTICEDLRFKPTFDLDCEKIAAKEFPDRKCVTKVRSTNPNIMGPCVVCTVNCP